MKKNFLALVVLAASISLSACAQSKKTTKKSGPVYAKHIESNSQRTLPGARGMEPTEEIRHVIIWQGKQPPTSFYWLSGDAWMPCSVAKAHKNKKKSLGDTGGYTLEEVRMDKIKKGDTLELMPTPQGKFSMPSEIPKKASNTIFYKTADSKWLALPVNKIKKSPDIIMP